MEALIAALVSLATGVATNAIFDIATLQAKANTAEPNPVDVAIAAASAIHPNEKQARQALHSWVATEGFSKLLAEIVRDPNAVTLPTLRDQFDNTEDFHNPIARTAHVETMLCRFFIELDCALLRSKEGNLLISRRLEQGFQRIEQQLQEMQSILTASRVFRSLLEFNRMLEGRSAFGYRMPFQHAGWLDGESPIQHKAKAFLDSDARVMLVIAPGGFGKTRLMLELGLWIRSTMNWNVVAVATSEADYAHTMLELPNVPTVILVDDGIDPVRRTYS